MTGAGAEPTDAGAEPTERADGEAHWRLAGALYFDDRLDEARVELEAAYRGFRAQDDLRHAARAAITLGELHSGSFGHAAVSAGWLARAKRLLERVGPCVEWGYYELALMGCDRPDVDELERSADRALEIAAAFDDSNLEVRALADSGLALVSQGRLSEGFARLDEAMTAIVSGEVTDPQIAGMSFCAMLSSCDRAGDVRRAEEWLAVIKAQLFEPFGDRPRVLHTHCRLAYGSVLSSAGRWTEAEVAILEALGPQASMSLGHRVEAIGRLAELRVHQGRVDEAAELVAEHDDALSSCYPVALVHLTRGRPDAAVAAAHRGLRGLVGDVTRSVPLLAVVVEAELARGDVDAAEAAARRLATDADRTQTAVALAESALATGRVQSACGEYELAIASLAAVQRHLAGDPRPLMAAVAQRELAEVLALTGDVAGAVAEAGTALARFDGLGAVTQADRTRALLRRLGAHVPTRGERPANRLGALTPREAEVLDLLRLGLSNAEIGGRLFISAKTAEHHVGRILTKLGVRSRAEAAAVAAAAASTTPQGSGPK